jgi:response regulator RpfG family c-di-GMP phosphodiesterase
MVQKILVVEDNDFFREAISDLLTENKFKVFQAPNGRSAKDLIAMQNFDLVLTDIQMPGLTGIELLAWSKTHKPVPFIMMTGFSLLLETKTAYELGAVDFLAKPFNDSDLLAKIRLALKPKGGGAELVENTKETTIEYGKVSIDEFIARPKADFDVFIKLSEEKYIKVITEGESIESKRVSHYKEKGVKYLHIKKSDFGKLLRFNLDISKMITKSQGISVEKKANFMKYTGEVILEKAFVKGLDRESFKEAQAYLTNSIELIADSGEMLDLLGVLNSHTDWVYAHSLGVAMYSVMMTQKLGYESSQTLFKLSMAGMFHNIGEKEIDREILEKPRHLLSAAERKVLESHVSRGKDILLAIKGIPEDIVQIVYEHHEDSIGQGYPNAKTKRDSHPLSPILQVANLFVEQALKGPHYKGKTGLEAIQHIEKMYQDRFDPKCIQALKSCFSA